MITWLKKLMFWKTIAELRDRLQANADHYTAELKACAQERTTLLTAHDVTLKKLDEEHDKWRRTLEQDMADARRTREESEAALVKEWSGRFDRAMAVYHSAMAERHIVVRRPAEDMGEDELRAAFDVPEDNDLFQAVLQVIDERILEAVELVSTAPSPVTTPEARTHAAGGLDELRELQTALIRRRQRATAPKPAAKDEGD